MDTLPCRCPSCRKQVKAELMELRRHLKRQPDLKLGCPSCGAHWWAKASGGTELIREAEFA